MERAFTKRNPFRCNGPLQRNEIPFVKPFAANLGGQARDAPDDPQMWQERCFSTSLATSGGHLVHLWVVGGLGTGGFLKKKIKLNDTKGSPGVSRSFASECVWRGFGSFASDERWAATSPRTPMFSRPFSKFRSLVYGLASCSSAPVCSF